MWTFSAGSHPDLTGATVAFTSTNNSTSYPATIVTSGVGAQTVVLDLTASQSDDFVPSAEGLTYTLRATLSGGAIRTLATGRMVVSARYIGV